MTFEDNRDTQTSPDSPGDLIENFIKTIPDPNRKEAISKAQRKRIEFLTKIWQDERSKLSSELIVENDLTGDLDGWNKYLRFVFNRIRDKRFKFEDWSTKYLAEMLITLEEDLQTRNPENKWIQGSYYDYYLSDPGISPEIWGGETGSVDSDSLLAHSIHPYFLTKAIKDGAVGRGGRATLSMSENRIVDDRGYVIIFQANEIEAVGYPLLRVQAYENENEWRSVMPIDITLARAIIPTSEVPDRQNASKSSFADSYFREDFLRQLPRL